MGGEKKSRLKPIVLTIALAKCVVQGLSIRGYKRNGQGCTLAEGVDVHIIQKQIALVAEHGGAEQNFIRILDGGGREGGQNISACEQTRYRHGFAEKMVFNGQHMNPYALRRKAAREALKMRRGAYPCGQHIGFCVLLCGEIVKFGGFI